MKGIMPHPCCNNGSWNESNDFNSTLIISISSPVKDRKKGSLVAPDQSCSEHCGAACSWKGGIDKQRCMAFACNRPSNAAVFQHDR